MIEKMASITSITPRKLIVGYFVVITIALLWILISYGSWCSDSGAKAFQVNEKTIEMYENAVRQFEAKERILNSWESKLSTAEKNLRKQFPDSIESILSAVYGDIPTIYAITPTFARPVQKAELIRLANTFLHVPNFHWIVVEDAPTSTDLVKHLLEQSGLKYTLLHARTPAKYKLQDSDPNWRKPRGVLQRNKGLDWIRDNLSAAEDKGVVYFADDDNTYDVKLFEEMRYTSKVSVWPVGLVGYLRYERPLLTDGKVTGFFTYWRPERPFPMDMAGFAINLSLLLNHPKAQFSNTVQRGYLESAILSRLVKMEELEPKADNCTKILVWHTRTEKSKLINEDKFAAKGLPGSDPNIEV